MSRHDCGTWRSYYAGCRCQPCKDAKAARERQRRADPDLAPVAYLPVEPLAAAVDQPNRLPKPLGRAFYRAVRAGRVSVWTADRIAIALGRHPIEVWGDTWWEAA